MKKNTISVRQMIRQTDRAIRDLLNRKNPATLYDPARYLFEGGGKRLRSVMTLLAYRLIRPDHEKAIPAAAAVEILHNFSLVHDDIMDHDDLRRGRPTVHKKWNESIAILSGDLLAAKAYQSLGMLPEKSVKNSLEIFNGGFISLCEGQALDKEFETRERVEIKEYLKMIGLKTAALFVTAMRLGIAAASGKPAHEKNAADFGRAFGLAFQIQDDLLDVTGDEKTLGKDIGSDLVEQKKTYVSILVSRHPEGPAWLKRFRPGRTEHEHRQDLDAFKIFLTESGIHTAAEKAIATYINKAIAALDKFPYSAAQEELIMMTLRLWKRNQ